MVKNVFIMLLAGGLVAGLSLPALAVSSVELHKLTASDANTGDEFGYSVGISGTTAIVGAYGNEDAGSWSGSAYLYEVATGSQIAKLTASDAAAGDYFGISVALSGSTAIVGAYQDDDTGGNSGSAYLCDFSDPCSIIETKLTASDANTNDWFGRSVAISGNTAIVGAYGNDDAGSSSGSAYLYDFSDPCSITETKLTASDAAGNDWFGASVAISGSTALVGARLDDDAGSSSGSAYLYDFSDPCSITETKLTASDANAWDDFGFSVALSGSTALVGARWDDDAGTDSGSAYLYDFSDPCNITEIKLTASDANAWDDFGFSVALSGTTALVGAYLDDDAGDRSGSAYLFCLSPVGDNNLDCRVDLRDFALMAGNWMVDCVLESSDPACLAP